MEQATRADDRCWHDRNVSTGFGQVLGQKMNRWMGLNAGNRISVGCYFGWAEWVVSMLWFDN